MSLLLTLCVFLLSLSNLWLWLKVYNLEHKTAHNAVIEFIDFIQEYAKEHKLNDTLDKVENQPQTQETK